MASRRPEQTPTHPDGTPAVFLSTFQDLVPRYLEVEWTPAEGVEPRELAELLSQSPAAQSATAQSPADASAEPDPYGGVPLPLALYEFHRALGSCPELLETEHFFFDADELDVREDFLLFLEDAEESTVWGLPVADAALPDPLVWRRSTGADAPEGTWTSEGGTFSEFTLDLLEWTFSEDEPQEGPDDDAAPAPARRGGPRGR